MHNYIRKSTFDDSTFRIIDQDLEFTHLSIFQDIGANYTQGDGDMKAHEMTIIWNSITSSLVAAR